MTEYQECKICKGALKPVNATHNLKACNDCKLVFCATVYTQEQFIQVYDELYNQQGSVYARHSVDEFERLTEGTPIKVGHNRSRLIRKHILNGRTESVLEIGSGIGLVGAYVRSKNKEIEYLGIEIDTEAFKKSQQLGLNTINGDFTLMETLDRTYDVIMLWEVIEHLQDLKLFLDLSYRRLNKGGVLILSTPNYNKIHNYPNREKDRLFQNEPPIHLNFFTRENIVNCFQLSNFGPCKVTIKKFPYRKFGDKKFYIDFVKGLFGRYHGPTIYFEARKK